MCVCPLSTQQKCGQDGEGVSLGDTVPPRANLFTSGRVWGSWGKRETTATEKNDKIATEMYVGVFRNVKSLKTIPILPTSWITQRNKWGGNYFFCGDDSESGVRNGTLVNIQRMDSPHRCGQIMTGRLLLYNIFTGNPPNSLSLSSSY